MRPRPTRLFRGRLFRHFPRRTVAHEFWAHFRQAQLFLSWCIETVYSGNYISIHLCITLAKTVVWGDKAMSNNKRKCREGLLRTTILSIPLIALVSISLFKINISFPINITVTSSDSLTIAESDSSGSRLPASNEESDNSGEQEAASQASLIHGGESDNGGEQRYTTPSSSIQTSSSSRRDSGDSFSTQRGRDTQPFVHQNNETLSREDKLRLIRPAESLGTRSSLGTTTSVKNPTRRIDPSSSSQTKSSSPQTQERQLSDREKLALIKRSGGS